MSAEQTAHPGLNTTVETDMDSEEHAVVTFHDSAPIVKDDYQQTSSALDALTYSDMSDASLSDFLSRPVLINSLEWSQGTTFSTSFQAFNLLMSNTGVLRKLNNYSLFRFSLCVRVMINGMPFHQGRLGVSFTPLTNIGGHRSSPAITNILYRESQLPGTKASPLNPAENETYEIKFPFFFPENYFPLGNYLSGSTLPDYAQNYAVMDIFSYGDLFAANSEINQNVGISVYAWFEDVELGAPTVSANAVSKSRRKGVSQAVPKEEESEDGIISSVTSAFAAATGELSGVPFIGSYAKMGSDFLNKTSRALRIFGFSRAPILTDPSRFRYDPVSSLALTSGAEVVDKLTFDPKQGLSVDPALYGLGPADQMSFEHICSNWSYIGTANWAVGSAADTRICQIGVSPYYAFRDGTNVIFASMSLPAPLFTKWAGTIEYKLVFASSKYHRGRLNISFDPDGINATISTTNLRNTIIVDLSETTEVTFTVSWAQPQAYLDVPALLDFNPFSQSGIIYNQDLFNGSIDVRVLNELTAPVTPNSIDVYCFARACPDIEYAVPTTALIDNLSVVPSGLVSGSSSALRLYGEPSPNSDIKPVAYFGEKVVSFRPLLKRYTNWTTISTTSVAGAADVMMRIGLPAFPAGASNLDPTQFGTGGIGTVITARTPVMSYLRTAYVGWKGGTRWKAIGSTNTGKPASLSAFRNDGDITPYTTNLNTLGFNGTTRFMNNLHGPNSWVGAAATSADRATLEYENPFYSRLKFAGACRDGLAPDVGSELDTDESEMYHSVSLRTITAAGNDTERFSVDLYVAAAEDFDFVFFLGSPTFSVI